MSRFPAFRSVPAILAIITVLALPASPAFSHPLTASAGFASVDFVTWALDSLVEIWWGAFGAAGVQEKGGGYLDPNGEQLRTAGAGTVEPARDESASLRR